MKTKTHHLSKKETKRTPIAFLTGMFTVDTESLLETLPPLLRNRGVFCYSVHKDNQDFPFDPDTSSILNSVKDCERISFDAATVALEDGRADGLGIILRKDDGLCVVRLATDTWLEPTRLPNEIASIISRLNTYTVFGIGGKTITILCEAFKPQGFLNRGALADGTEIVVEDCDCFVSLSGMPLREGQDILQRQEEIEKLCTDCIEPRCPVVGTDGALMGIVPAVLAYADRREDFDAEWKRLVAKNRRSSQRSTTPPEFSAAVEMLAHLMGVIR